MCENDCPYAAARHCALQCVPNGYCVLANTLDDPRERPFPTAMYTRAAPSELTPGWVINSHVHMSQNRFDRYDLPLVIRTRALAVNTQRYPGHGMARQGDSLCMALQGDSSTNIVDLKQIQTKKHYAVHSSSISVGLGRVLQSRDRPVGARRQLPWIRAHSKQELLSLLIRYDLNAPSSPSCVVERMC